MSDVNYKYQNETLLNAFKSITNSTYLISKNFENIPSSFKSSLLNAIDALYNVNLLRHNERLTNFEDINLKITDKK